MKDATERPKSYGIHDNDEDEQGVGFQTEETSVKTPNGLLRRENVNHISPMTNEMSPSPDTTPKGKALEGSSWVPSISLTEDEDDDANSSESDLDARELSPPPSFPALNSAQRASAPSSLPQVRPFPNLENLNYSAGSNTRANRIPPPLIRKTTPPANATTTSTLMPPPPIPSRNAPATTDAATRTTNLMPPPSIRPLPNRGPPTISNSLRVPSTGPLPNRGPPTNSLAPPPSAAAQAPNPRKKVLLSPGHSPLDWANLQRSSSNLSGVNSLQRVTPSQLKQRNGRKGKPVWASFQGKVYNVTPYVPYHPGGEGEIRRAAGKDGEKLFMEVHPWVNWENMLGECLVGIMVGENDNRDSKGGSLDDMD